MAGQIKLVAVLNGERYDIVNANTTTVSEVLTLPASGWVDNTQRVTAEIDVNRRNIVDALPQYLKTWVECGVYVSEETSTGLTFVCTEVPTEDLQFQITSMVIN